MCLRRAQAAVIDVTMHGIAKVVTHYMQHKRKRGGWEGMKCWLLCTTQCYCIALLLVALPAVTVATGTNEVEVSLTGPSSWWTLCNRNGSITRHHVTLPGNVVTHLYGGDDVPLHQRPLYRFGDTAYRWIAYENWTYTWRGTLPMPSFESVSSTGIRRAASLVLTAGVRVFAEVSIGWALEWDMVEGDATHRPVPPSPCTGNGTRTLVGGMQEVVVGKTASQFVPYAWDITKVVEAAVAAVEAHGKQNRSVAAAVRVAWWVKLRFNSTVVAAAEAEAQYADAAHSDSNPLPDAPAYINGLPGRNFVRTEQSSFGWDWGPAFASVGTDGDIFIRFHHHTDSAAGTYREWSYDRVAHVVPEVWNPPNFTTNGSTTDTNFLFLRLRFLLDVRGHPANTTTTTRHAGDTMLTVPGSVQVIAPTLRLSLPTSSTGVDMREFNTTCVVKHMETSRDAARGSAVVVVVMKQPQLWWPRGYGPQTRHNVSGTIRCGDGDILEWQLPSPLAVRSVALVTKTLRDVVHSDAFAPLRHGPSRGSDHHRMEMVVNGVPVFAKGSNVIPPSALPSPKKDRRRLLQSLSSAIAANMNMLRVWGGGSYLGDWFYEWCDAKGVMVWQEFMFACAEYPVNADFLRLVQDEVTFQVQRLARYGSIVMWSANNENGVYDRGNGSAAYRTLYMKTVLPAVAAVDESRPVWPSSPSQGFASGVDISTGRPNTSEPFVSYNGSSDHGSEYVPRGDVHYYNYFQCPNVSLYPRTHFASEFGFQSLPWLENIAAVSDSSLGDWSLNSSFMHHRQHHPGGNVEIAKLLVANFFTGGAPRNASVDYEAILGAGGMSSSPAEGGFLPTGPMRLRFSRIVFLSQLQQALCVKDQIAFYRRGREDPRMATMGALYWQLNQNWQAPSWTSLEYGGQWKVLHYAVRDAFSPQHLSLHRDENGVLFAHMTNDPNEPSDGDRVGSRWGPTMSWMRNVSVIAAVVRLEDGAFVWLPTCGPSATTIPISIPPMSGAYVWNVSTDAWFDATKPAAEADTKVRELCHLDEHRCAVWVGLRGGQRGEGGDAGRRRAGHGEGGAAIALLAASPGAVKLRSSMTMSEVSITGAQAVFPGCLGVTVESIAVHEAVISVHLAASAARCHAADDSPPTNTSSSCRCPAFLYVFLRVPQFPLGVFSKNLFHLIPCPPARNGSLLLDSSCPGTDVVRTVFRNPLGSPIGASLRAFQSAVVVDTL